jgi:hypothetical protein
MTATIQIRRDTFTNWNNANPTLAAGEIGLDTTNGAIKVGTNALWNATPYLSATIPSLSSAATDFNDATLRVQGRYIFGTPPVTNAPAAPINIDAALDGRAILLVLTFGTSVVHMLWTEGDGSRPQKSWHRVYDGDASAWRAWVPDNIWAVSGSEGVDVVAKSITLKDTGTGLTVDGNSTLTGNVTVNGTTTLGNDNADIVMVRAGTVSAPIITTNGDSNTGIYFPAGDKIAISAFGTQQLLLDGTTGAGAVGSAIFRAGATVAGKITGVSDPTNASDAVNKGWIDGDRIGGLSVIHMFSNGAIESVNIGGIEQGTVGTPFTQTSNVPSTIRTTGTRTYRGVAIFSNGSRSILMDNSATKNYNNTSLGDPSGGNHYCYFLFRIT